MEKRRAESAGTFDVASDIVKPRISHIREPRLSKMQLVTRLKCWIHKTVRPRYIVSTKVNTFHIHFHTSTSCRWQQASCQSSFLKSIFSSNYTAMAGGGVETAISTLGHSAEAQTQPSSSIWLIQVFTTWRIIC